LREIRDDDVEGPVADLRRDQRQDLTVDQEIDGAPETAHDATVTCGTL
jgi:hypothetical protein